MQRRVHVIGGNYTTDADGRWLEQQLNKRLTGSERIVHVEFKNSTVLVVTEDLGLGPRTK